MNKKPPFSLKEDLRPADLWFWKDWQSSLDLKLCHLASKGLWVEMLGIMFNSKIKGTLAVNGKKIDSKELTKIVGASIEEVEPCLTELESRGVFSRLEDGTIINRRMYRGESLRFLRAKAGKIGARKRWQKDGKSLAGGMAKDNSKRITPLVIGIEDAIEDKNKKGGVGENTQKEFDAFWESYPLHIAKQDTLKAFTALRRKGISTEEIRSAVIGYRAVIKKEQREKKYFMYPATFLRNEKWKDFVGIIYKPPL